jgi:hypothetical protein
MTPRALDAAARAMVAKFPGRAAQARDNPELVPWFVNKIGRAMPAPPDMAARMLIRKSVEKAPSPAGRALCRLAPPTTAPRRELSGSSAH